ncbi:hypothetical protein CLV59_102195 [Chitinophaga dinghuensis]|uniref:Knr4/Smi1-like domain-containing protein n=1 Tax=Chitinophaga dinghuensis TaxID=1539050 RepID=A0A327W8C1_9BACT|nr:SMI1/KNR4 family protein [Chitinophaga dinghuensis]RAJ85492.1 hypothetical protein CLV59_102195 [Chitinophaga dinghuensis]
MENYIPQVARIKKKLAIMRVRDKEFNVFGAVSHQYKLKPVLTEQELALIEAKTPYPLPAAFKTFLAEIGNGGAGPDHGVWGLYLSGYQDTPAQITRRQEYLPVIFSPDSTPEDWKSAVEHLEATFTAPEIEDQLTVDSCAQIEPETRMMGGLLEIGEVGCGVSNYLVMHGEHQGRVVHNPHYLGKPVFYEQDNFLDWYEEWLDNLLKGEGHIPIRINGTFFSRGKHTAEKILQVYDKAAIVEDKLIILTALFPGSGLSPANIAVLEKIYTHPDERLKWKALALLTMHAYDIARPLLKMEWKQHQEEVLSYIYTLADQHAGDWQEEISMFMKSSSSNWVLREELEGLQ